MCAHVKWYPDTLFSKRSKVQSRVGECHHLYGRKKVVYILDYL